MFVANQSEGVANVRAVIGSGLLAGGEVVCGLSGVIFLACLASSLSGERGAGVLMLSAQAMGVAQAASLIFAIVLLPGGMNQSGRLLRMALLPGVIVPLAIALASPESLLGVAWVSVGVGVLGVGVALLGARCCRRGQSLFALRSGVMANQGERAQRKAA